MIWPNDKRYSKFDLFPYNALGPYNSFSRFVFQDQNNKTQKMCTFAKYLYVPDIPHQVCIDICFSIHRLN